MRQLCSRQPTRPTPAQFTCDECPAKVPNADLDALITDDDGLLERVLCRRCRARLGVEA